MRIPSSKPFLAGNEIAYISDLIASGNIDSDGRYARACAQLLEERYSIKKVLMTPSCTAALEMAAMLCDLGPDDEVILPSFTFTSTANAILRLGARPVFVDIRSDTLNLDERLVENAISSRTKAIFPVHYAGVACQMNRLMEIASEHHLLVVEDAAQAVNAFFNGRALGSIGTFGAYSFHSTKNYVCGEGGALCINSTEMVERAEIIRDKGTNRSRFARGEIDKYTWIDIGSSYAPAELVCAFLNAQLEVAEWITTRRRRISRVYDSHLHRLEREGLLRRPITPAECESNYHLYYILLPDVQTRDSLMHHLNANGIGAVSHYVPLHSSPMGRTLGYEAGQLPITEELSGRLLRLPNYPELSDDEQIYVIRNVISYLERIEIKHKRPASSLVEAVV
jgi:dTDP-4-amino-4,6-dideoxygalactose transaminase